MSNLKKAYGYVRVSGPSQEKGFGISRQKEIVRAFTKRNGTRIVRWFSEAHTGTEEDRPKFAAMLFSMMTNGVKIVIVESLDRFARDLMIQNLLLAKLAAEGITLIAANTGEDVTAAMAGDPMRRMLIQMQGLFAELDKGLTVKRLREGKEAKRRAAKRRGEKVKTDGDYAFGEHPDIPEEIPILKRIGRLRRRPRYGKRLSYERVAVTLNVEGLPTRAALLASCPGSKRTPRPWTKGDVYGICKRHGW